MHRTNLLFSSLAGGTLLLLAITWQSAAQQNSPPRQTSLILGQALPDLTDDQKDRFVNGLKAFSGTETREDGLGPVFNGTSCSECHKAGAIGGAGTDLTIARVTRIGGIRNGAYSDLPELGGPVLQARSLREFDTACPIAGETIPEQARFVSRRIATPLFGAGLIEAIPAATILARVGQHDPDRVHGSANFVVDADTGKREVGRFGWKAQHSSLLVFAADAYLNEMGITTAQFPDENLPQGQPIPPAWDSAADPEDHDDDAAQFADFMRFLAAPGRRLPLTQQIQYGERVFQTVRCTACHVPEMKTGPNATAALSNQTVRLYSDLLLHAMGPNLADGIRQEQAKGDQFRTAPLWGLSRRSFFLHDGRAATPEQAVQMHGGEATAARDRFMRLDRRERAALLAFLNSL